MTCGKDMDLCKIFYREWGPKESVSSGGLLPRGRSAHACPVMLGMKTAAIFFPNAKLQSFEEQLLHFLSRDEITLIQILVHNVRF